jgi:hypothetical protein
LTGSAIAGNALYSERLRNIVLLKKAIPGPSDRLGEQRLDDVRHLTFT